MLVPEEEPGQTTDAVYYVGANILSLEKRFAFRPLDFRLWIAIHEVTHRAQFTGVPWMREYFLGLVHQALDMVDPDPRTVMRALTAAVDEMRAGRNPLDDGGLVGLVRVARAARRPRAGASVDVVARRSRQRRDGRPRQGARGGPGAHVAGAPAATAKGWAHGPLHKLLGIEQKMRQYEVGEKFVRGVYEIAGPRALDRVWESPASLPLVSELDDPAHWLARVGAARV